MNTEQPTPPAVVLSTAMLGRFEAWFRANHHARLDRKMADGSYNDPTAYAMWQAWQAAEVEAVKRHADLCRKCKLQCQKDTRDFELCALRIEQSSAGVERCP